MDTLPRRAFLKVAGVTGLALMSGCRAEAGPTEEAPPAIAPAAPSSRPPTEPRITPTGELFTTSYSSIPRVDQANWQLIVGGLVERPVTLRYADLAAFEKVVSTRTLECIGNPVGGPQIGNPRWGGFLARELWDRVGIRPDAIRARFRSADDYETSVNVPWITQPDVMLVTEINGEPLPSEHGFPLRILMPGLYGQKMPKWLTRIEFVDEIDLGYWESRGWSDTASVQTNSIIEGPRGFDPVTPGTVPVFGVAFAGLRRITAVDVRIDDGPWLPASLLQDESPLVWTQWSFDWTAQRGSHRIAVRATDDTGFVQTGEAGSLPSGAFPDGTDEIHSVLLRVEG